MWEERHDSQDPNDMMRERLHQPLLALKIEDEETTSCGQATEHGKSMETDSSLEPPKKSLVLGTP